MSLPQNIHLLTFEPWKSGSTLIRFEHILAKNEDKQYSQNVTFNLSDVLRSLNIVGLRETTLAGNEWLDEAKRFKFTAKQENSNQIEHSTETGGDEMENVMKKVQRSIEPKPDVSPRQYYQNKRHYKRYRASEDDGDKYVITLAPMEIRTFVIEF